MNYRKKQIFKTSFSILLSIFFLFHMLFFLTNAINNIISIGTAITKKNNKTYDEVELSYFYGQDDKPLDLFLKKFELGIPNRSCRLNVFRCSSLPNIRFELRHNRSLKGYVTCITSILVITYSINIVQKKPILQST